MPEPLAISTEEALSAVRARDAGYDGQFFFAVVTTGIFCRPSCSSRQPRPENIRFFQSQTEAKSAGFRACKRCKPEAVVSKHQQIIEVARYIEAHADQSLSLNKLAAQFDLSPTYLQKTFKSAIGLSPKAFQNGIRQQRFKSLLKNGRTITDAVFEAGYGSLSRVYEGVDEKLGMSPTAYRDGAHNEAISFVCRETVLGMLMLAATNKGVCFAMFAEEEAPLQSMLEAEFPNAIFSKAGPSAQLDSWFDAINKHLLGTGPHPLIPTDVRGTAFQIKVWEFLQSVKPGETVSYSDVANGIGQPTATRSAASACGKNRIALLIPCHRVLRSDGSLGGFRWGIERKQQLLNIEQS